MSRYLFTYRGAGDLPALHLEHIGKVGKIVDRDARTLLVEVEDSHIPKLSGALTDWGIAPEKFCPLPDTRQKILRSPAAS